MRVLVCGGRDRRGRPYNAKAGPDRNQRMIDEGRPGLVIAFPGGDGTADMIHRAQEAGIEVVRIGAPLTSDVSPPVPQSRM